MAWWTAWLWRQSAKDWKTTQSQADAQPGVGALGGQERAVSAVVEHDVRAEQKARGGDRQRQRQQVRDVERQVHQHRERQVRHERRGDVRYAAAQAADARTERGPPARMLHSRAAARTLTSSAPNPGCGADLGGRHSTPTVCWSRKDAAVGLGRSVRVRVPPSRAAADWGSDRCQSAEGRARLGTVTAAFRSPVDGPASVTPQSALRYARTRSMASGSGGAVTGKRWASRPSALPVRPSPRW